MRIKAAGGRSAQGGRSRPPESDGSQLSYRGVTWFWRSEFLQVCEIMHLQASALCAGRQPYAYLSQARASGTVIHNAFGDRRFTNEALSGVWITGGAE